MFQFLTEIARNVIYGEWKLLHCAYFVCTEAKLAKIKDSKGASSATSMINTLKMAREDSARLLISQSTSSTTGIYEEPYSFLDKLYSTNTLYRHMFPATQALGTDEKDVLLKNDELSRVIEEDSVVCDAANGEEDSAL